MDEEEPPSAVATRRLQAVVEFLGEKYRHEFGWKSKAARKLGAHPSNITRILKGERTALHVDTLEYAARGLKIRRDYFFDKPSEEVDFRDYLLEPGVGSIPAGLADYLEAEPMSHDQRRELLRLASQVGSAEEVPSRAWALLHRFVEVSLVDERVSRSESGPIPTAKAARDEGRGVA